MDISILTPICTGIAVADRKSGSKVIHFRPMELLPNINGRINEETQTIEIDVNTPEGLVKVKLKLKGQVPATWFNRDANRVSTPDIMKGERVLIWRQGNSENYYWEQLDLDNHLRQTERVVIAFSNTNRDDRSDKVLTKDNSYFIEFDTIDKFFKITTNKNDGEPFAHEIELNTGKGFLRFKDDVGNHILKDSANTVIEFMNKDGTQYRMDKKNILEVCMGSHTRKIGGDMIEIIGGTRTRTVKGVETVNTKQHTHNTSTFTINSDMNNFSAGVSNFKGAVVAASVSFGAGLGGAGAGAPDMGGAAAKIKGKTIFDGPIEGTSSADFDSVSAKTGAFDSHGPH